MTSSTPGGSEMSDPSRELRRAAKMVAWIVATMVLASCSTRSDAADDELAIDAVRPNEGTSFAMAADALDRGVVGTPFGQDRPVVVVPSDDALLALDADALARFVGGDGIAGLLGRSVVRAGYEPPPRKGLTFLLSDGTPVLVDEVDGDVLLNSIPLVELASHGGFDLVVVDGFVIQP